MTLISRNKIMATVWMLIGAVAGFWVGAIPVALVYKVLRDFLGGHSPFLGLVGLLLIITAALGGQWFKYLFYKGVLWGYRPDKKP
jgi:hypothetical protein